MTLITATISAETDHGRSECMTGSGGTSPAYYLYTTASGYKVTVCYDLEEKGTPIKL